MKRFAYIVVLGLAACTLPPPETPPIDRSTCQHSWENFHFAPDAMEPVIENATDYRVEFDKLNAGSVIRFRPAGLGFKITVRYGGDATSKFLGKASVRARAGGHVVSATVTMNRTFLDRHPPTVAARVLSQELGHLAGLDHQRGVDDSAMEDCVGRSDWRACITNGATGFNAHDLEQLAIIYAHEGGSPPTSCSEDADLVVHAFPVEGAGH